MRLVLFLVCIGSAMLSALKSVADTPPVDKYQVIEELDEYWQVYDTDYKSYVPYLKSIHGNPEALHFELNLDNYKGYHLKITTLQPVYLFMQAKLNRLLPANGKLILNVDSLRNSFKESKILFSLFNKDGHITIPSASIVHNKQEISSASLSENTLITPLKFRNRTDVQDFAIVAALLILALFAFLWNYHPKAFKSYYNLKSLITLSIKEDTVLISRPLSRINLLFIFNHSLLLAFLYILIQKSSDRFLLHDQFLQSASSFGSLFYYFGILTFAIFLLLVGKYFLLLLIGKLFNLSSVVYIHFYEYMLFSRIFYCIIVPAIFSIYVVLPAFISMVNQELIYIIVIFNFIRLFIINFALNKATSVKNLYLFSYLCATELTPLLIGLKILVE
jgi:hypothetical protein